MQNVYSSSKVPVKDILCVVPFLPSPLKKKSSKADLLFGLFIRFEYF